MRKILPMAGLLLVAVLFYVGMVMGSETAETQREQAASMEAVGQVRGTDLDALTAVFGRSVPFGSRSGAGYVTDASVGTLRARLLIWQASNGLVTSAVRPAQAAQLLRREELTLDTSALWTLGGQTLLMAEGEDAACAYYDDGETAYSLYMENADIERLLTVLSAEVSFPQ